MHALLVNDARRMLTFFKPKIIMVEKNCFTFNVAKNHLKYEFKILGVPARYHRIMTGLGGFMIKKNIETFYLLKRRQFYLNDSIC